MEINTISDFNDMNFFLSNFSPSVITVFNKTFRTVEHAYQCSKTENPEWQNEIFNAPTPGKAKRLGSKCPIRSDWEEIKDNLMELLLKIKFSNPWYQNQLLLTGDKFLVEGNNWHDNYWGDCNCDKCKNIIAENKLGKMLMHIRDEIKNGIKE